MRQLTLFLLCWMISFSVFSQIDTRTDTTEIIQMDTVFVCPGRKFKAFHSHDRCIGLDTCKDSLLVMTDAEAIRKYRRKACCICWDNVEKNCVDDNPDAYAEEDYEENYEEPADLVFLDDLFYFWDGGPYIFIGILAGSVVILSNEVYIGTSYAYLPPGFLEVPNSLRSNSFGFDILFRKNLRRDAFEYGLNYHEYKWQDDRRTPATSITRESFMFKISYLHEMNRHFTTIEKPPLSLKFYLGPQIIFGFQDEDGFGNVESKLGIGGTMVLSLPLGKRFHLDLRNDITTYASEVKLGIRWMYQRRLLWERR